MASDKHAALYTVPEVHCKMSLDKVLHLQLWAEHAKHVRVFDRSARTSPETTKIYAETIQCCFFSSSRVAL